MEKLNKAQQCSFLGSQNLGSPPLRIRKWNYLVNITAHCVASFNFSIYCHFVMETLLLLDNDE